MNFDLVLLFHVCDVFFLVRHHKAEILSSGGNSGSATNTIHVFFDLTGKVPLNDPVDTLEVEASRSDISADEET